MFFQWLKRYMPRSLYGRAALILVLPVVMLQLIVLIAFMQRHFEGVTEQMTRSISREIALVLDGSEPAYLASAEMQHRLDILGIGAQYVGESDVPVADQRRWYDFSGKVVIRELNRLIPGMRTVRLPDDRVVWAYVQTASGPLEIKFGRRRVSASNPHQLLVSMVFFGGILTGIAFIYMRNQLRPITRLARAAEAFGRGRHVPYKPSGAIEVRAAGNAFLDMRARIERQIEQRTLMLSGVSHDLRTPLTRLKLGLSLLDDAEREPMERDVEDMQRLVDEFLSFARGASEGEPEKVDPVDLVSQVVADAQRADTPVSLASVEGQGEVILRPVAMRRALENLVGNAVRYGTRAEVSVMLSDKALRIRVEDDGPGIAPELRGEALKPFARLDASRNQNKGPGVGLGLAITTDIVRAHGGVLRLGDSDRLGGLRADIVIAR